MYERINELAIKKGIQKIIAISHHNLVLINISTQNIKLHLLSDFEVSFKLITKILMRVDKIYAKMYCIQIHQINLSKIIPYKTEASYEYFLN